MGMQSYILQPIIASKLQFLLEFPDNQSDIGNFQLENITVFTVISNNLCLPISRNVIKNCIKRGSVTKPKSFQDAADQVQVNRIL